jgi:hypothetical protein
MEPDKALSHGEFRSSGAPLPVVQFDWHDKPLIIQPDQVIAIEKLAGVETVERVEVDAVIVRTAEPIKYWHLLIERAHRSSWMTVTIHNLSGEHIYIHRIRVIGRRL